MPIVDVELVCASEADLAGISARRIADVLGAIFGSPPGRTWARVRALPASGYAENDSDVRLEDLPVFVTVLKARLPERDALPAEVRSVTEAIAACVGRPPEHVHVRYEPAAAGRQAFGGNLVG
jgi:phenylpyruvate tautomerase PptA (4-oxalocrotonate tautomerase family)